MATFTEALKIAEKSEARLEKRQIFYQTTQSNSRGNFNNNGIRQNNTRYNNRGRTNNTQRGNNRNNGRYRNINQVQNQGNYLTPEITTHQSSEIIQ